MRFLPSTASVYGYPGESYVQIFSDWWSGSPSQAIVPPKPGEPFGPSTSDGKPVAKGTKAYEAILAEINKKYGPIGIYWRDVSGDGNYTYRQYSDGRIFIQVSGQGSAPVKPKVQGQSTGSPPKMPFYQQEWFLPAAIIGGTVLIGAGILLVPRFRKGKKRR